MEVFSHAMPMSQRFGQILGPKRDIARAFDAQAILAWLLGQHHPVTQKVFADIVVMAHRRSVTEIICKMNLAEAIGVFDKLGAGDLIPPAESLEAAIVIHNHFRNNWTPAVRNAVHFLEALAPEQHPDIGPKLQAHCTRMADHLRKLAIETSIRSIGK